MKYDERKTKCDESVSDEGVNSTTTWNNWLTRNVGRSFRSNKWFAILSISFAEENICLDDKLEFFGAYSIVRFS